MNIVLQHWTGDLGPLQRASVANMERYAAWVGAEYRLLRGDVFDPSLAPPCQKMAMLGEQFDAYDWVVMVDTDMFATPAAENVFTEASGTGMRTEFTSGIAERMFQKHPSITNPRWPYWGGAIWRLSRELRVRLRRHLPDARCEAFSGNFNDEGIMHRLAGLAGVPQDYLPQRWCWCSYLPNPGQAAMVHIRTKITPTGPKRDKWANYQALRAALEPT